jgi:hypothetical protein
MRRRRWDPKIKALIVLEGLKGTPIADICAVLSMAGSGSFQRALHHITMQGIFFMMEVLKC